ncbi:MAG: hypothetical protein N3E37_03915 [Candidatus Micrarchaeota archaeon]|nr:hypothetical protein [Candidatus Micrarchaeota archaeon]
MGISSNGLKSNLKSYKLKAQGAFEYMVSYGWAILIVIVLGILLFSLGVFNPSQTPTASGFVYIRPISWSFSGGEAHASNITIAFENVAGQNLVMWVNDTSVGSIKFKQGGSVDCYFNTSLKNVTLKDSSGNDLIITDNKAAIPVGSIVTVTGRIGGATGDNCGGLKAASYRYTVFISAKDEYGVVKTDTGLLTGRYI